ncbi:MAG: sodium:alanine symporter family protein [Pseudomonadota bacterium]
MQYFEAFLNTLDAWLGSSFYFPFLLVGAGIFFTLYLGFPQIRYFRHAWQVLRGKHSSADDPGDTTHFQALSTALSGTVGTGNIGGVALAIYLGGPAALFWMWVTAFFGMTTKFVEVSVSHKYRRKDDNGQMVGGPMLYMEHGLGLKWLAVFFAVATVISSFGSGNMPQANSIAAGLTASFEIPGYVTGGVLAVLLGLVIIGGIKRIAIVAATLVPFAGLLYTFAALVVIGANVDNIGPSFAQIIGDAFSGSAATGGFLGATFAYAFNRGVNRGLYSNEAGQGSAPIAHASAKTKEPVSEGMVSLLEPFIDTLIICTLTGLVILSSGVWHQKFENTFQAADTIVMSGSFDDTNAADVARLGAYLNNAESDVQRYSGPLDVVAGRIQSADITLLHNRSIAEDLVIYAGATPFTGTLEVREGSLDMSDVRLVGKSLLHSVPLTAEAFKASFLGAFGEYTVTLGLVLFAFTTAIAWSYYGDRAVTYLVGARWVMLYRILYVVGFFVATVTDTGIIWLISYITVALMTIPNLFGLFMMSREMKGMTRSYAERQLDQPAA